MSLDGGKKETREEHTDIPTLLAPIDANALLQLFLYRPRWTVNFILYLFKLISITVHCCYHSSRISFTVSYSEWV